MPFVHYHKGQNSGRYLEHRSYREKNKQTRGEIVRSFSTSRTKAGLPEGVLVIWITPNVPLIRCGRSCDIGAVISIALYSKVGAGVCRAE